MLSGYQAEKQYNKKTRAMQTNIVSEDNILVACKILWNKNC